MTVAVTGGSGLVGRAVVRHLVEKGEEVRALARSEDASSTLDALGAVVVRGDVRDEGAVERLVEGSRRVFHIAGVNEMCSRDPAGMWSVNVEATMSVLEACLRAGVERVIHTSSAATIGEEQGAVGTEESIHRGYFLSEYERSKTVAERLVLDTHRDLEVVVVNPSSVQGPGRATGTGGLLLAAARGSLPFMVDATISVVDIDDCARGHLMAADAGMSGERYILSGAVITIRDAVREIDRRMGEDRRRPRFLKPAVVTTIAPVADAVSRVLGKPSLLCAESARVLLHGHRYDGSKAMRELGLEYTRVEVTLGRTLSWFADEGLL